MNSSVMGDRCSYACKLFAYKYSRTLTGGFRHESVVRLWAQGMHETQLGVCGTLALYS